MSFALSLSGLNGAARAIDVVGNNIANSQTVGFKTSKARFADVLPASAAGGPAAAGGGVSTAIINQQFTQGNLMASDNPLDMAITGLGFFRMNRGGEITYTRDGQFQLAYDASSPDQRFLVNHAGSGVTGYLAEYTADPQGVIVTTSAPQNISIDPVMPAATTGTVSVGATLDARVAPPSVAPFAANNPLTYNNSTALSVYDSLGVAHDLRMYFSRSSPGNLWELRTTLDNGPQTGPVNLSFDTDGLMSTAMPLAAQTYAPSGGGSLSVALDFTGSVQYGHTFSVDSMTQDGYREGALDSSSGFSVGADGVVRAFYSNGQSRQVAQIVLANFVNPDALISLGGNQWVENPDPVRGTGKVLLDTPGRALGMGLGPLQGGAKEQSNVDLSTELVSLIEQQRNYQASAQTFKILDQVLQNLANMR
ncbi:MAG: flagellar hook protein FlgE [Sulfuritalea sp.]|nr:flagellar hook protein FlgE [Sulfuritalea sp.]